MEATGQWNLGKSSFFRMGGGEGDTVAPQPHCPTALSPCPVPPDPFAKSLSRHCKGCKVCLCPPLLQVSISIRSSSRLFPSHLTSVLPKEQPASAREGHMEGMTTHKHFPGSPFQPCPIFSFAVTSPGQILFPVAPRLLLSPLPPALPSLLGLQTGQGLSLFTGTSGGSKETRRQPPLCCTGALVPWREREGWELLPLQKKSCNV